MRTLINIHKLSHSYLQMHISLEHGSRIFSLVHKHKQKANAYLAFTIYDMNIVYFISCMRFITRLHSLRPQFRFCAMNFHPKIDHGLLLFIWWASLFIHHKCMWEIECAGFSTQALLFRLWPSSVLIKTLEVTATETETDKNERTNIMALDALWNFIKSAFPLLKKKIHTHRESPNVSINILSAASHFTLNQLGSFLCGHLSMKLDFRWKDTQNILNWKLQGINLYLTSGRWPMQKKNNN